MIRWVARVNSSHPYLENDPSPSLVSHHLRISPWLWFRMTTGSGPATEPESKPAQGIPNQAGKPKILSK